MATPVYVPEVARVHYDDAKGIYRVYTATLAEAPGDNEVLRIIKEVLTIAEVLAAILEAFAPLIGGVVQTAAPVGDLHALAAATTAAYPVGIVPPLPRVVDNLPAAPAP